MANNRTETVYDTSRLLTIAEAADLVRLSRTTIYVLMNSGQLASVKIGKARRIPLAALIALVEANIRTSTDIQEPSGG